MARVARGKALVAKLRAQAGVRDPEALAAWLGRFKKARKSGMSVAAAKKAADGKGSSGGGDSSNGSSKNGSRKATAQRPAKSQKAKEEQFHKQYEQRFAGTEGRRTIADSIVLRAGMGVELKEPPSGYGGDRGKAKVVKVHGPNEVEIRFPDGTKRKVRRTQLLLTIPGR